MFTIGVPPFNGFVSEWLVYQGLFGAGQVPSLRLAILAIPGLALVGALALACFAKVAGIIFLGTPRSVRAAEAKELAPLPDGTECGMLFVFNSERPLSFWMFKTIVPLDIVYIDSNRHVINCYSAQPFETRLIYPSQRPAQYVLEVSAGLMKRCSA